MTKPVVNRREGGKAVARVDECKNFLIDGKCNKWIIDHFKFGKHSDSESQMGKTVFKNAEEVCSECPNFDKDGRQEVLSGTHQLFMKGKIVSS